MTYSLTKKRRPETKCNLCAVNAETGRAWDCPRRALAPMLEWGQTLASDLVTFIWNFGTFCIFVVAEASRSQSWRLHHSGLLRALQETKGLPAD